MFLIFDTETNGLPKDWRAGMSDFSNWPRVIQLAWQVVSAKGAVIKEYKTLIRPDGWTIPKEKFWIDNGYSTERNLDEGFHLPDVLDEFVNDYNQSSFLVAHNMAFDHNVLGCEMLRYQKKAAVKLQKICTMQASIELCALPGKYGFKFPKLEELHGVLFQEGFDGAHDALADVNACRRCLFELINRGVISVNIN